jgi:hypothetical protein
MDGCLSAIFETQSTSRIPVSGKRGLGAAQE